ncbi:MAG: alpha/beta-hydrolase N-terminal domain-containing protein, partial [Pseudonocardia sp.]
MGPGMAITPAGRGTAPIGARDSPDAREGADIDTKDRATTAEPVDGATATPDSAPARHRWWHLTPPGLSVALIAVCLSLTPSLLPRSGLIQGLVCGIAAAIGYGLGVVGA